MPIERVSVLHADGLDSASGSRGSLQSPATTHVMKKLAPPSDGVVGDICVVGVFLSLAVVQAVALWSTAAMSLAIGVALSMIAIALWINYALFYRRAVFTVLLTRWHKSWHCVGCDGIFLEPIANTILEIDSFAYYRRRRIAIGGVVACFIGIFLIARHNNLVGF